MKQIYEALKISGKKVLKEEAKTIILSCEDIHSEIQVGMTLQDVFDTMERQDLIKQDSQYIYLD